MSRSVKAWVFTVNNPIEPYESAVPFDESILQCLVYQLERGESGTLHLQGYVEFVARRTIAQAKQLVGLERAHLERRAGSKAQAIDYCTKDASRVEGPWVFGNIGSSTGKRNDLKVFVDSVTNGLNRDDIIDEFPEVLARYPRFVDHVYERTRIRSLIAPVFEPREGWQSNLWTTCCTVPDPRAVLWYYDSAGNTGKSWFANSCPDAYIVTGGKHADIFYAYKFEKIVIFDWPRDHEDRFPYGVVEAFKNGYFLSTKYEVKRVKFAVPHVIVFSNFYPDRIKLSQDRWEINEI
jgi:hypothetical protein